MPDTTTTANGAALVPLTCGDCKYWHAIGANPSDIGGPKIGECREHLQATQLVRYQVNRMTNTLEPQPCGWTSGYAPTGADLPACGRFVHRLELKLAKS